MAREKPLYRNNLDRLDEAYPDKQVLKYQEIAELTGLSIRTVKKYYQRFYKKELGGVSKTVVASILS